MATRQNVEVWLAVDENGDYEVGTTRDESLEKFADNIGTTGPLAVTCLTVNLCLPEERTAVVTLSDDVASEIIVSVEE
jgi:hypothetical protein